MTGVLVTVLSGALAALGLAAVLLWGGRTLERPWARERRTGPPGAEPEPGSASPTSGDVFARWLWAVTVAVTSGVAAGLLVAGGGGRLAMRLLAVTAGSAAQGRETEAEEIVGRITFGGTLDFLITTGLFFGIPTGLLYLLVHRGLPGRRWSGLAFGALLLAVVATRIDPLRADNPDFGIVGPGWVAVLVFATLVVVHGAAVAAIAARVGPAIPLRPARRDAWRYGALVLVVPFAIVVVFLLVLATLTAALARLRPVVEFARADVTRLAIGLVVALVAAVSLPGAVQAIVDILGT